MGRGGMWIDGRWYRWDEEEERLREGGEKKSEGRKGVERKEEGCGTGSGDERRGRKEREED